MALATDIAHTLFSIDGPMGERARTYSRFPLHPNERGCYLVSGNYSSCLKGLTHLKLQMNGTDGDVAHARGFLSSLMKVYYVNETLIENMVTGDDPITKRLHKYDPELGSLICIQVSPDDSSKCASVTVVFVPMTDALALTITRRLVAALKENGQHALAEYSFDQSSLPDMKPSEFRAILMGAISKKCASCSVACTKKCCACSVAFYCSVECQRKHWLVHQHSCDLLDSYWTQLVDGDQL